MESFYDIISDIPASVLAAANRLAKVNESSPHLGFFTDFGDDDHTVFLDLLIKHNPGCKRDEFLTEQGIARMWDGLLLDIQAELAQYEGEEKSRRHRIG